MKVVLFNQVIGSEFFLVPYCHHYMDGEQQRNELLKLRLITRHIRNAFDNCIGVMHLIAEDIIPLPNMTLWETILHKQKIRYYHKKRFDQQKIVSSLFQTQKFRSGHIEATERNILDLKRKLSVEKSNLSKQKKLMAIVNTDIKYAKGKIGKITKKIKYHE